MKIFISGVSAAFVPVHSGGPVPDFNGVPFSAHYEHLIIMVGFSYPISEFCQGIFGTE